VECEGLLSGMMDTFFKFEHNTFCHKIIERFFIRLLQQMAVYNMDQSKVLEQTKLIDQLLNTHKEAVSCESQKKATKQFTPFVYNMGESLQQIADADESFKDVLEANPGWKPFALYLVERRAKLDVKVEIEPAGSQVLRTSETVPTFDSESSTEQTEFSASSGADGADPDDGRFEWNDTEDMPSEDDNLDYDVEQAEILLTKQEVQALA